MDFSLGRTAQWNAFSRFQGSNPDAEEELQSLTTLEKLGVDAGRSDTVPPTCAGSFCSIQAAETLAAKVKYLNIHCVTQVASWVATLSGEAGLWPVAGAQQL